MEYYKMKPLIEQLSPLQRGILNRNINTDKLEPVGYTKEDLLNAKFDPFKNIDKLLDISEGAELIKTTLNNGEFVLLVSDYDADGLTSASVMELTFRDILEYDNYRSVVNTRRSGNGFNPQLVQRIKDIHDETPVDLIITADHGSSDNLAYKELKEYGIGKIIVTDHHIIPKDNYPEYADIVINPQRDGSTYHKDVSGCFIAYLTMVMSYSKLFNTSDLSKLDVLLPYVCLSTLSDVMSLDNPINRQVINVGLKKMNMNDSVVWSTLRNAIGIDNTITYNDINFKLSPVINTGNRCDVEELVFEVLTSTDKENCEHLTWTLLGHNVERKAICKRVINDLSKAYEHDTTHTSVICEITPPIAINGIVANRIGDQYGLPAFCFTKTVGDYMAGSGRGVIPGVHLTNMLRIVDAQHPGILVGFGGHSGAAGCKIYTAKYDEFKTYFNQVLAKEYPDIRSMVKEVTPIATLPLSELNLPLALEINAMGPYGKDWEYGLIKTTCEVRFKRVYGSMVRLGLGSGKTKLTAMYFLDGGSGLTADNLDAELPYGTKINIYTRLDIGSYRGKISLDIKIEKIEKVT